MGRSSSSKWGQGGGSLGLRMGAECSQQRDREIPVQPQWDPAQCKRAEVLWAPCPTPGIPQAADGWSPGAPSSSWC